MHSGPVYPIWNGSQIESLWDHNYGRQGLEFSLEPSVLSQDRTLTVPMGVGWEHCCLFAVWMTRDWILLCFRCSFQLFGCPCAACYGCWCTHALCQIPGGECFTTTLQCHKCCEKITQYKVIPRDFALSTSHNSSSLQRLLWVCLIAVGVCFCSFLSTDMKMYELKYVISVRKSDWS